MAAAAKEPPLVAIACQGGGSHAAFGAGVMHRLLDDLGTRFRLAALSGTSGGAVNAALAWSGLVTTGQGGPAIAQKRLHELWKELAANNPVDVAQNLWGQFYLDLPFTWEVSPYDWDFGARAKMKILLDTWIEPQTLPRDANRLNKPFLFVGATDIQNGVSVAIRGDGKTVTRPRRGVRPTDEPFAVEDILASIAIPPFYKEEERRDTTFWDGLFSINPPIYALTKIEPKPAQIWVIQINPQRSLTELKTIRDIQDRRNELSGNLSLNKELDMIEIINDLVREKRLGPPDYERIEIRIVGLEDTGRTFSLASKFDRSPRLLEELFELGREWAPKFYEAEYCRTDRTQRLAAEFEAKRQAVS